MSKAVMQQALTALENLQPIIGNGLLNERQLAFVDPHLDVAIAALRAALVEQDDDLTAAWMAGAAEERKRAEQSLRDLCAAAYQVVGVADGPVEMLDNLWAAAEGEPLPHDPGAGLPWSPPSPQPLTDFEILDVYTKWDSTPGSSWADYARAVEAEVLKRIRVQR